MIQTDANGAVTPHAGRSLSTNALLQVEDVRVEGDNLKWIYTRDKRSDQATTHQVVLAARSTQARPEGAHIICCLKEEAGISAHPFQLLLLATDDPIPDELADAPSLPGGGLPQYLQVSPRNEVDVLVSAKSGIGQAGAFWQDVVRPLLLLCAEVVHHGNAAAGFEPWNLIMTQDEQSVRRYAKSLKPDGPSRTIILLSGDGAVVDLLNGRETTTKGPCSIKLDKLPILALLPLGTGNALFHSLQKPRETSPGPTALVLALRTLFQGTPSRLPMFKASFTPGSRIVSYTSSAQVTNGSTSVRRQERAVSSLYGAIVASYALHASIVHESDTPEHRVHGSKRFGMVAQQLLRESHPYKAAVEVSTRTLSFERDAHDTHGYVLVSMVSNLERTFTISPDSKPLDGKLRLVHMGPVGGDRVMEAMMGAYEGGKHTSLGWEDGEKVRYQEVECVRVTTQEGDARWRKFCVDGTIVDVEEGGGMVVAAVDETAFRVLV